MEWKKKKKKMRPPPLTTADYLQGSTDGVSLTSPFIPLFNWKMSGQSPVNHLASSCLLLDFYSNSSRGRDAKRREPLDPSSFSRLLRINQLAFHSTHLPTIQIG